MLQSDYGIWYFSESHSWTNIYHMKRLILLSALSIGIFNTGFTQEPVETELNSEIKQVTVFFQGAQIVREAKFTASAGKKYIFKIQGIETGLVRSSLQIKTPDGISIDQVNHKIKYVEVENHDTEINSIQAKLATLKIDWEQKNDQIELIGVQRSMLNENRGLSQSKSGMTVEQWKAGVAYYEQKTTELILRQRENERAALVVQQKMQGQMDRLKEITGIAKKQTIELLVEATCSQSVSNGTFRLSFLIPDATWTPKYDLKMNGLNKPLALDVKADITQSSGNDWKNIDLILTSEDPFKSAEKPQLKRWDPVRGYRPKTARKNKKIVMKGFGSIEGRVIDRDSGEELLFANVELFDGDQSLMGIATDMDGNYKFSNIPAGGPYTLKSSYIGYTSNERDNVSVIPDKKTTVDIRLATSSVKLESVVVSASKYEMNLADQAVSLEQVGREGIRTNNRLKEFEKDKVQRVDFRSSTVTKGTTRVLYRLKQKFSIPSDNKPHTAQIDGLQIDADFKHFTAPVEFDKAFLVSEITGWEEFNLLDGIVSLHVDGSYIGETSLNSGLAEDTLTLSLGTDASIIIERKELREKNKRSFFSNKKLQQKSYEIKVKNTRSSSIFVTVQDQIPVSSNKEIEVELVESTDAKLDEDTGILEWVVEIPSGETWETSFTFSIKYPNYQTVYID